MNIRSITCALTFVPMLLPAIAQADWTKTVVGTDESYYMDWSTMKVTGPYRRLWVLYDRGTPNDGAQSTAYLMEFDCRGDQWKILSTVRYSGSRAMGSTLSQYDSPYVGWSYIPPNSTAGFLAKPICAYK